MQWVVMHAAELSLVLDRNKTNLILTSTQPAASYGASNVACNTLYDEPVCTLSRCSLELASHAGDAMREEGANKNMYDCKLCAYV